MPVFCSEFGNVVPKLYFPFSDAGFSVIKSENLTSLYPQKTVKSAYEVLPSNKNNIIAKTFIPLTRCL